MNLGDLLDDTVKHFPPVGTNVDDEDTIIMDYDNGLTASFVLTTGEACHEERLEIIGTKAKLLLEDNTLTITRHQDVEEYIKKKKLIQGKICNMLKKQLSFQRHQSHI